MKRISVVVPVYNASKYIGKCIESVLNQSYKNVELILIDDGSLDDSLEIMREYEKISKDNFCLFSKEPRCGSC